MSHCWKSKRKAYVVLPDFELSGLVHRQVKLGWSIPVASLQSLHGASWGKDENLITINADKENRPA
jgi:hypothetical protein